MYSSLISALLLGSLALAHPLERRQDAVSGFSSVSLSSASSSASSSSSSSASSTTAAVSVSTQSVSSQNNNGNNNNGNNNGNNNNGNNNGNNNNGNNISNNNNGNQISSSNNNGNNGNLVDGVNIDGFGGFSTLNGFSNFYGSNNFDGLNNVQVIQQTELICQPLSISIVQQQLAILAEAAKRILTTQICEVEVQTITFQQFSSNLYDFQNSLLRNSNQQIGYDSNIANLLGQLQNSDGSLNQNNFGFSGSNIGQNTAVVSSNWNGNSSPSSVQAALQAANGAIKQSFLSNPSRNRTGLIHQNGN